MLKTMLSGRKIKSGLFLLLPILVGLIVFTSSEAKADAVCFPDTPTNPCSGHAPGWSTCDTSVLRRWGCDQACNKVDLGDVWCEGFTRKECIGGAITETPNYFGCGWSGTGTPPRCGNGVLDSGEVCDKALWCTQGYQTGCYWKCLGTDGRFDICNSNCSSYESMSRCYNLCTSDPAAASARWGGGSVAIGSACPGGGILDENCNCAGTSNPTPTPTPTVSACGNGVLDAGEVCDKAKNCITGKDGYQGCQNSCVGGYPNNGRYLFCKNDCSGYREGGSSGVRETPLCWDSCTADPDAAYARWGKASVYVGDPCPSGGIMNASCQCVSSCPWDIIKTGTSSGKVDAADSAELNRCYSPLGGVAGGCQTSDLNNNGVVNALDYSILLTHWGNCPVAP